MSDELVECDPIISQKQPTFVTLDEEILRKAIDVCESAIENARMCLDNFDRDYGRATKKNRMIANCYESEIVQAKSCLDLLRNALHWPPI